MQELTQHIDDSEAIFTAIQSIDIQESSAEALKDQVDHAVGQIFSRLIFPILESIEDTNVRDQIAAGLGETVSEYVNRAGHD